MNPICNPSLALGFLNPASGGFTCLWQENDLSGSSQSLTVGLEPFPFFLGNSSLTKYSGQELPSDVFLMWIRKCQGKISFDHERVLPSGIRAVKAAFPQILD
jgi:hypothetical protein